MQAQIYGALGWVETTIFCIPQSLAVSIIFTTLPWGVKRSAFIISVLVVFFSFFKAAVKLDLSFGQLIFCSFRYNWLFLSTTIVSSLATCGDELLADGRTSFIPGSSKKLDDTIKKATVKIPRQLKR